MDESSEESTDSENTVESTDDQEEDPYCFVPYNERPEWNDIKPCPIDPPEPEVLNIAYSFRYRNVHDYFRAIFKKNELSHRALDLTRECISLNPANSTMWSFRRKIIKHLKLDLADEKRYISSVILESPKNYQVWQHRKWIIETTKDPKDEKSFTSQLFSMDGKNYHAWQHRQWVVLHFSLWDGELKFTEQLLNDDVMNNSAWNHRYYVVNGMNKLNDEKSLDNEVNFVIKKIKQSYDNESSWNYLRGILSKVGLNKFPQVNKVIKRKNCLQSLAFRIDAIDQLLKNRDNPNENLLQEALMLVNELKNEIDPIRCEYWAFIGRSLKHRYNPKDSSGSESDAKSKDDNKEEDENDDDEDKEDDEEEEAGVEEDKAKKKNDEDGDDNDDDDDKKSEDEEKHEHKKRYTVDYFDEEKPD